MLKKITEISGIRDVCVEFLAIFQLSSGSWSTQTPPAPWCTHRSQPRYVELMGMPVALGNSSCALQALKFAGTDVMRLPSIGTVGPEGRLAPGREAGSSAESPSLIALCVPSLDSALRTCSMASVTVPGWAVAAGRTRTRARARMMMGPPKSGLPATVKGDAGMVWAAVLSCDTARAAGARTDTRKSKEYTA